MDRRAAGAIVVLARRRAAAIMGIEIARAANREFCFVEIGEGNRGHFCSRGKDSRLRWDSCLRMPMWGGHQQLCEASKNDEETARRARPALRGVSR